MKSKTWGIACLLAIVGFMIFTGWMVYDNVKPDKGQVEHSQEVWTPEEIQARKIWREAREQIDTVMEKIDLTTDSFQGEWPHTHCASPSCKVEGNYTYMDSIPPPAGFERLIKRSVDQKMRRPK